MDSHMDQISSTSIYQENSQESAYVPIRVLGKGAFGEAVLYRKVADDSLVVWKEIDLRRLSDKERGDSQNEIEILSLLNHANIVCYYNHFLDGETLLIEMEYANGGNLAEKISAQEKLFPEEVVLWYFHQVAAAVAHIHEYGILHRDIKALNIFLTKSGLIKLGDFGISKILASKTQMAESYVGTPYYMSPELIKGEQYNQKSDIWAMGCVLYELLSLSKVYDATNPLKLAWDIVQTTFEDIDEVYSENIRTLLHDMLDKDPVKRPTADEVLKYKVMDNISKDLTQKVWELNSATRRAKMSTTAAADVTPVVTSKTSEVYLWGGGKLTPHKLEQFIRGRSALQVACGPGHLAVVTVEKELYVWAFSHGMHEMVGQLGHGDTAAYKAPKKVDAFDGIAIKQVSCGEDFTIVVTEEGSVYSFGSDYYGCLGCGGEEGDEVCTPVLLPFFLEKPVEQVACGDTHVIALTRDGEVYTWGCGEFGRLGLGSEDDFNTPQRVKTRGRHAIRSVHASSDGSFLVKTNGRVLACGSNENNKLGFNSSAKGLRKRKEQLSYDIPCKTTFATVKPLSKYHIVTVASSNTHSAALDQYGHLMTFGSNKYGQLGVGDFKERHGINLITGALTGKQVAKVACGDGFTVIATSENQIYSWGLSENGRLGTVSHSGETGGRGPGGQCFALPRTIFGSLHVVSDVACRHWNTILVAEKVLAQKTIRSSSVLATKSGATMDTSCDTDDAFHEESCGDESRPRSADSAAMGESTVPLWLRAELNDAEYIPVSASEEKDENRVEESLSAPWMISEDDHNQDNDQVDGTPVVPPLQLDMSQNDVPTPSIAIASNCDISNVSSIESSSLFEKLAELQSRIEELEKENNSVRIENTRLNQLHETLELDNEALKEENMTLKTENSRLTDQVMTVIQDNMALNKCDKDIGAISDTKIVDIHEQNTQLIMEMAKIRKSNTEILAGKSIVDEQNIKLSYEVFELKQEITKLKETLESYTNQNAILKCELEKCTLENVKLKEDITMQIAEHERSKINNEAVEDENNKLTDLVNHQTETIRAQAETIKHLEEKSNQNCELTEEIWEAVERWQEECISAMVSHGNSEQPFHQSSSESSDHDENHPSSNDNSGTKDQICNSLSNLDCKDKSTSLHLDHSTPTCIKSMDRVLLENDINDQDRTISLCNGSVSKVESESPKSNVTLRLYKFEQDDILSVDESKWCKSSKKSMMKSYKPTSITKVLKGVTTAEEMV